MRVPLKALQLPKNLPAGARVIITGVPEDETARALLVVCGVCGEELSKSSLGSMPVAGVLEGVVVFVPLRCPECNAPAVFVKVASPILHPPS